LFEVGQSYSVQPGVAKKSVGKIKVTAIRREQLQDISQADWDKKHKPGQQWVGRKFPGQKICAHYVGPWGRLAWRLERPRSGWFRS
jgi:hypothetical protein